MPIGRSNRWLGKISLLVLAALGALTLSEVVLRIAAPRFRLSYTQARFSPRYHHVSPEFSTLLQMVRSDAAAIRATLTVVILGDSFVAGDGSDPSQRFTSVMQRHYDSSPSTRPVRIVNLGFTSYSTLLYERLYRDVVLPLHADVVIVCLDQTDAADDYLYEQELSSPSGVGPSAISDGAFADTVLQRFASHPVTFFGLRHSRLFLGADVLKQTLTGSGFIAENAGLGARDQQKLRLYLDTSRDPRSHADLFTNSAKYIRSIAALKPPQQRLYFVTYPRAENLAGQRKTTLLNGMLPDHHASTPYFEHWIEQEHIAERYPTASFVHTSDAFRAAIAATGEQYYLFDRDVHWTARGHRLFAEIIERAIGLTAR